MASPRLPRSAFTRMDHCHGVDLLVAKLVAGFDPHQKQKAAIERGVSKLNGELANLSLQCPYLDIIQLHFLVILAAHPENEAGFFDAEVKGFGFEGFLATDLSHDFIAFALQ